MKSIFQYALLLLGLAHGTTAAAGGERVWELAGYAELSRGELQQAVLSDKGEVLPGLAQEKIDLEAVGLVWSAARDADGTLYLGTAYDGKIFRVDGSRATLIATTGNIVVTDMVVDKDGALLAATLPAPTVWRINRPKSIASGAPVQAEPWISLGENEMIWTLAQHPQSGDLYIGTGPEGKIWTAGKDRQPQLFLDSSEKHILDILPTPEGIFAGTSPGALLLKVTAPGVSFALADFEGTEVKSIVLLSNNQLAVGVNDFSTPGSVSTTSVAATAAATAAAAAAGQAGSTAGSTTSGTKNNVRDKGFVYLVESNGATSELLERSGTHITSLAAAADDTLFAAMGNGGKILSVNAKRTVYEAADLAERDVMCVMADTTLTFAGTGDAGGAYRFASSQNDSMYLSPVLDAETVSTFGSASWYVRGTVMITARSGNTVTPDDTWSPWSAPLRNYAVPPLHPARYVQFRFLLKSPTSALVRFELTFKPQNRRAVITQFNPDTPFADTRGASKGDAGTSERTIAAKPGKANSRQLSLSWTVNNPDGDTLRYRLYYKPIDQTLWIPVFSEDEPFTKTAYPFATESVPEGRYHFKLTAEDSIDNPAAQVLDDEILSVPVEIDNHPPLLTGFHIARQTIAGMAKDTFSAIAALEYAIDGGNWLPLPALDGILDSRQEAFQHTLSLARGGHVIAVRATDRSGNFTVSEVHTEITD